MPAPPEIVIAGRKIGPAHPPYVICELSGNHNGSLDRALELVDAAAATGCDAIKIQTYTADTITMDVDRPEFRISGGLWDGRSLYDLYQEGEISYEDALRLADSANEVRLMIKLRGGGEQHDAMTRAISEISLSEQEDDGMPLRLGD